MTVLTEELRADVRNIVEEVLSHDSNEKKREELEKLLLSSKAKLEDAALKIEELTSVAASKDEEIEALESQIKELEDTKNSELAEKDKTLSEKAAELESISTEKSEKIAELEKELEKFKTTLADIEIERAAEVRFAELKEANVALTEENSASAQLAKIRDMSDEAFASYKEELVALLKQAKTVVASEGAGSEEAGSDDAPPPAIEDDGAEAPGNVELGSISPDRVSNLGEMMSKYVKDVMRKSDES
jgi:chromosome segregation ATPase